MAATACTLTAGTALKSSSMAILMYADLAQSAREFVAGLTGMKPPIGFTRAEWERKQAGTYAVDISGTPKLEKVTAKLDWQKNDPLHIELYNRGKCQNDNFKDVWFYMERNLADPTQDVICIPNHVENPNGGFSVSSFAVPEASLDADYKADFSMTCAITSVYAFIHLFDVATPIYTFTAGTGTGDTITRSSGSFVDDGITEGMRIFIDDTAAGGTNYRKIVTVDTLAALTLNVFKSGTSEDAYLATDATGLATTVLRAGYQM